jgi:hypothetical protein
MVKATNYESPTSDSTHRSTQLQLNYSIVLELLALLPALISPRNIDLQRAQTAQDMLFRAGYNITDIMLQASSLVSSLVKWYDTSYHRHRRMLQSRCGTPALYLEGPKAELFLGSSHANAGIVRQNKSLPLPSRTFAVCDSPMIQQFNTL